MPGHTHERGTMNITGTFEKLASRFANLASTTTGCFTWTADWGNVIGANSGDYNGIITFDASRSWTGETSSVGGNAAHSLMQPFLSVFMWRRTN